MTSRDLVINALNHERVERVPRDLWPSPAVEDSRGDELAEIEVRFPRDIVKPDFKYPPGKRASGKPYRAGRYTDAWGCTLHVTREGTAGEPEHPPLADQTRIAEYKPPVELLSGARVSRVNRGCADTSRFVLARTQTRPFERLQLLRGTDAALADLAHGTQGVRDLLAMLHDFFCREMEMWADTDVDGVMFRDDWGSPDRLLVDPKLWRDLFKPLYHEYCQILHAKDKFAFFHSGGSISSIFGDLVKIGIDAIHSELLLMNVEQLAKRYRGRVTFWGEIDRQHLLPSDNCRQIREAVIRVRKALDFGSGGAIAQCRWDPETPIANIAAVFEQWMLPLPMHA